MRGYNDFILLSRSSSQFSGGDSTGSGDFQKLLCPDFLGGFIYITADGVRRRTLECDYSLSDQLKNSEDGRPYPANRQQMKGKDAAHPAITCQGRSMVKCCDRSAWPV